jgi:hypothetical protein
MYHLDALLLSVHRMALVRPRENAAFQIVDVGDAGALELLGDGGAPVTDRAVHDDSCAWCDSEGLDIRNVGIHAMRTLEMADLELGFRPNVEKGGSFLGVALDPSGKGFGVHPLHIWKSGRNGRL